jgi:hypothetical protein
MTRGATPFFNPQLDYGKEFVPAEVKTLPDPQPHLLLAIGPH